MPWQQIVKYAFIALILGSLVYWHYQDKNEAVNAVKQELTLKAEQEARAKEQLLTYQAFQKQREKDEKISDINGKLSVALRMLRERPNRPSDPATPSGEACTGTKLFREDAEFLTREAARADRAVAERDYYYERYEDARRTLAGEKQDEGRSRKAADTKPVP